MVQPADGVEAGMVEELVAATWRMQRAYLIEKQQLDSAMEGLTGSEDSKMATAFFNQSSSPDAATLHQYLARLQRMKSTALSNLQRLRNFKTDRNDESEVNPAAEVQ